MKFIVRIPELDSTLYEDSGKVSHLDLFRILQKLENSGKLIDGGLLADDRGGYLLMEADSCSEHEALLNSIFDPALYSVESHPTLPLRKLTSLVDKISPQDKKTAVPRSVVVSQTKKGKIVRRMLMY